MQFQRRAAGDSSPFFFFKTGGLSLPSGNKRVQRSDSQPNRKKFLQEEEEEEEKRGKSAERPSSSPAHG